MSAEPTPTEIMAAVGDIHAAVIDLHGAVSSGFIAVDRRLSCVENDVSELKRDMGIVKSPIAIAVALAAAFFGGNHDNPGAMPDKYDEPNYGQQTANLRGTMGAGNPVVNYNEDSHLAMLFGGRTGIQMIEETLAQYGSVTNAPDWLKPMFNQLEAEFGESATGSGQLLIGDGGSGKHCNNQQIVGAAGTDGQVYQYTQLDSTLAEFQTAYAKARAAGQAIALSWDSALAPGSPPPSENYTSTSYQSHDYRA